MQPDAALLTTPCVRLYPHYDYQPFFRPSLTPSPPFYCSPPADACRPPWLHCFDDDGDDGDDDDDDNGYDGDDDDDDDGDDGDGDDDDDTGAALVFTP